MKYYAVKHNNAGVVNFIRDNKGDVIGYPYNPEGRRKARKLKSNLEENAHQKLLFNGVYYVVLINEIGIEYPLPNRGESDGYH